MACTASAPTRRPSLPCTSGSVDSRCSPVPSADRERAANDSRGPSAQASLQLPRRRVKLRGERTRGRGAWSERGGGAGGGEARTRELARHPRGEGRGGGPGGDSCLMVPSARLLLAALGCLPPADRPHARLWGTSLWRGLGGLRLRGVERDPWTRSIRGDLS